jgi:hypothetical protein
MPDPGGKCGIDPIFGSRGKGRQLLQLRKSLDPVGLSPVQPAN